MTDCLISLSTKKIPHPANISEWSWWWIYCIFGSWGVAQKWAVPPLAPQAFLLHLLFIILVFCHRYLFIYLPHTLLLPPPTSCITTAFRIFLNRKLQTSWWGQWHKSMCLCLHVCSEGWMCPVCWCLCVPMQLALLFCTHAHVTCMACTGNVQCLCVLKCFLSTLYFWILETGSCLAGGRNTCVRVSAVLLALNSCT